jgi:CYTH domain-containing protein
MASTSREIERKFLVDHLPEELEGSPRKKIRQGYIAVTDGGTEVRVRKEGKRHFLTIKEGHGENRGQEEIEINAAQFAALWPLTRGKRLKKVRYEVPQGNHTIEVDVYRGKLKGLTTAEVEFPDEAAAHSFQPPDWFGREVTGDEHYSNQNLARHGMPQEVGR